MTSLCLNISSTHSNNVGFVRVLASGEVVEAIVNISVGIDVGQKGVEVVLIGAVSRVVAIFINTTVVYEGRLRCG